MHLDYLCELPIIVEERSLSAAAIRLGISQPALSRHVSALETELGLRLINRGPEGISLTDVGSEALITARAVRDLEQDVVAHFADKERRSRERRLHVCALEAFPQTRCLLAESCARMNNNGQQITLRAINAPEISGTARTALQTRRLDMIVSIVDDSHDIADGDWLARERLFDVPAAVALPPGNPLSTRHTCTLDDLRSCVFISPISTYDVSSRALWNAFVKRCNDAHFDPLQRQRRYTSRYGFAEGAVDEAELCLADSTEEQRLRSQGFAVIPVTDLSFELCAFVRADDEVASALAKLARQLTLEHTGAMPVSHQSMYGSVARSCSPSTDNTTTHKTATESERMQALARACDEPNVTEDLVLPDGTFVDRAYVALRNRLNRIGDGLANDPVETSYDAIMRLWSVEEARAELEMPMLRWFTAYDWAIESGRELAKCEEMLERLSSRNLIFRARRGGTAYYHILGWIYGIWEFSVRRYGEGFINTGIYGRDIGTTSRYPIMHVCPVGPEVIQDGRLAPYCDWQGYIRRQSVACVAPCQCRSSQTVESSHASDAHDAPTAKDCPLEICLTFGEMAQYWIENRNGREVSVERSLEIARSAVYDHGMIPQLYFSRNPEVMCFCKAGSCLVLSAARAAGGATGSADALRAYDLVYDPVSCVGCGACVERCPMGAVTRDERGLFVKNRTCVACGQCALVCPAHARRLVMRTDDKIARLPANLLESYQWRSEDRIARGCVRDFTGSRLDTWVR
ncbi:LysR family transcriptional regulator [bacterium]|nr:LysR family transcriptional regulator [bacterium]